MPGRRSQGITMRFLNGTTFDPWELWTVLGIFFLFLMLACYYFIRFLAVRSSKSSGRFAADPGAEDNDDLHSSR